ncbi:hypothetical protein [Streptomyces sp. NPDC058953]|uniref:hypothetical protein n=1 Tax=Streptomyces sp. NPDC058953 TaxID=3346676 RepID=UPI0036C0605D
MPADARRPVVVVDVPPAAAGNLGAELGSLLARLRDEDPVAVRLVLSGAAAPAGDAGPLAQRLADAWRLTLEAPDAPAVLTPGGMLYVAEPAAPGGGWWRFAPDAAPEALGARLPAPRWQRTLSRVAVGRVGDCVARPVPAGLLLSPAEADAPRPDAPAYAAATHPDRVSVLLGVPRARPVPADDVATLLAGLPADARRTVRLVPADGRDAVVLAEEVCDLLGTELEVTLGLPVADGSGDPAGETVRLLSPEGEFTWSPPLTSVVCSPAPAEGARPGPRPRSWSLPDAPYGTGAEPASLRLPSGARAVAVRSGLWVGTGPGPSGDVRDRPADPRALRVTVDSACLTGGERDAHLKGVAGLVGELEPSARAHAEIALPPDASAELLGALRRFAVKAGLALGTAATSPSTAVHASERTGSGGPAVSPAGRAVSAPPASSATPTPPVAPVASVSSVSPVTPVSSAMGERPDTETASGGLPAGPAVPSTVSAPPTSAATPVATVTTIATIATETPEPTTPAGPVLTSPTGPTVSPARTASSGPAPVPTRISAPDSGPPGSGTRPALASASSASASPAGAPTTGGPDIRSAPAPVTASTTRSGTAPAAYRPPVHTGFGDDRSRSAFRELAADVWEEHSGAVAQALIKLPALRGSGDEGASVDLIAVRLYLSSGPDDPFGARALAAGTDRLRPYAACLASGLRRLPALRGTLVRAVPQPGIPRDVVPGAVLSCDVPLDVAPVGRPGAPLPPDVLVRYVIRSVTARRTSVLAPEGDGALFPAGSTFTVLARRERGGGLPARVLLAEAPPGGPAREPSPEALEKLDAAARGPASGAPPWPGRCTGPFVQYLPPAS